MAEIHIQLTDQDLAVLESEGALRIDLNHSIIDPEPAVALTYDGQQELQS